MTSTPDPAPPEPAPPEPRPRGLSPLGLSPPEPGPPELSRRGSAAPGTAGPIAAVRALTTRRPVVLVWFGTCMFALGPVMIAASTVSGPVFSFWRLWFGSILMTGVAWANHRRQRAHGGAHLTRTGIRWTVAAGVAFAVHQLLLMIALRATSVVDVTLMNTLAPVMVAVLAVPLFGERPGLSFRLWSAFAIVGAAMVAIAGSSGPHGQPLGVAFAAGNVVFYAIFFVFSKVARSKIDTLTFLAGATFVAALIVSGFVLVTGADLGSASAHDLWLCLAVAALPGFLGHFSITYSLKWVPANIPPVIMLAIPVISGTLAWFLLGQGVTPLKLAGGAVTLVGVAGAVRSPGARGLVVESLDLAEET